jgi:hypothetical protein
LVNSSFGSFTTSAHFFACPLRPKAIIERTFKNDHEVPITTESHPGAPQQIALLFDHLVGGRLQRQRYGDAERFRGLEVDD